MFGQCVARAVSVASVIAGHLDTFSCSSSEPASRAISVKHTSVIALHRDKFICVSGKNLAIEQML